MRFLPKWPRADISLHLRTKFLIGIIVLECLIMTGTILVVERQMRASILDEFVKLGIAISKNLSAVNANFVTTYNYVGIEQNVAKAVKDNNLAYALIEFFDGDIAAYIGKDDIKREVIKNKTEGHAFRDKDILVRYLKFNNSESQICDLASPIIVRDKQWATVRVGLSLENIQSTIGSTRKALGILGLVALALGCLISVLFASRITRPVASLVNDVEAISKGDYGQEISINTHDEIAYLAQRFGTMKESLKENIQLLKDSNRELSNTNHRLQGLFKASQAMNSFKNQDRLYDLILDTALMANEAYGASLVLVEPESAVRVVASIVKKTKNNTQKDVYQKLLQEQPFLYQAYSIDSSLGSFAFKLEYLENTPFFRTCMATYPDLEILSLPLGSSENITGYINLLRDKKGRLNTSEMQTLIVLASQTTTSIENNSLFVQLKRAYFSSIKSLAKTLELKDEYTHGHAERVAEICKKIGEKLDMAKDALKVMYNAALLHDIGKIGVLESILNKKSRLNSEEYQMIKKHPRFGEEILRPIFNLEKERNIVRHHHEREDGRGYPDRLDGIQLSLPEKIIIVADAFDAMNSKRSYRDAFDQETITAELKANKGKQFDHQVVDAFLEIYLAEVNSSDADQCVISFPNFSANKVFIN
ncbi:MAG: HD domain-containing protein [Deltaproteobacteria bacterium]|nr:MAG: HD domain-containing protein [Deltaproteobacteria bacterium]